MPDAYVHAAALWCTSCARAVWRDLARDQKIPEYAEARCRGCNLLVHPARDQRDTDSGVLLCPRDCDYSADADDWDWDETTYDSDDAPKGPYPDGGGEADSPQHCDGCHVFLENDLTLDGERYVAEAIHGFLASGDGQGEVIREWMKFYPDVLWNHGDLHEIATDLLELRKSPCPIQIKHAEGEPRYFHDAPKCHECLRERESRGWTDTEPCPTAEFLAPRLLPTSTSAQDWHMLCRKHAESWFRPDSPAWGRVFCLFEVS